MYLLFKTLYLGHRGFFCTFILNTNKIKKGLLLLISIIILSCSKDSTSGSGLFRDNVDKTYFILPTDDPSNPEFVIEFGEKFLFKVYDDDGSCYVWTKEGTFDTDLGDGVNMSVKNEILLETENTLQVKITTEFTGYASGDYTATNEFGFTYGEIDADGNVLGMMWFYTWVYSDEGIQYNESTNLRQIMTLPAVAQSSCKENDNAPI